MDSFKIVLIILTVFLIYCYLKNNGYFKEDITIFEGMNPTGFCSSGDSTHNTQESCEAVLDCPIPERSQIPGQLTTTTVPCVWTPVDPSTPDDASVSVGQVVASERPVPNPSGEGDDATVPLNYNVTNAATVGTARAEATYGTNTVIARTDPATPGTTAMTATEQADVISSPPVQGMSTNLQDLINNLLQSSRPGGGLCRRDADGVELPGDWSEESCTGMTGNTLVWKNRDQLVTALDSFSPELPQALKDDILTVKPGDVVSKTEDGNNIFQYRDTATGNITDPTLSIPLLPWNDVGYCLKAPVDNNWYDASVTDPGAPRISSTETNKTDCEAITGQLWVTPTNTILLDRNIRQNRCGISISESPPGPGNESGDPGAPDCKSPEDLFYPYCESNDGQEIMSKDWWKQRWRPGWSYEDICQGKTTENSWQSNQDLANLMGGEVLNYMVARHGTSVDSAEAQDDMIAQDELREQVLSDLQRAAGDSATAAAQLEVIRAEIDRVRNLQCSWASVGDLPYTGNYDETAVSMVGPSPDQTANGYTFDDQLQALTATNLSELSYREPAPDPAPTNLSEAQARSPPFNRDPQQGAIRNQLSCNVAGGFSRTPDGPLNPSVNCISHPTSGELIFNFTGCSAHPCRMPANDDNALSGDETVFHSGLYEFLDGTPLPPPVDGNGDPTPVDINTFMDTRTMTPRIRCSTGPTATDPNRVFASLKDTHQGGVEIRCPEPDASGQGQVQEIIIDGCRLNQCTEPVGDELAKYYINSPPSGPIDISSFYRNNHWAQNADNINQIETTIEPAVNPDGRLEAGQSGHRFNVCGGTDTDIPDVVVSGLTAGTSPKVREESTDPPTPGINVDFWNNRFKQPCFSCKAPNYFKVDDSNRPATADEMNTYWAEILNEEQSDTGNDAKWYDSSSNQLELYNYGAKATCDTPGSAITLSGCYENRCLNPGNPTYQRVYDGEKRIKDANNNWTLQKPQHMEDTVRLSESDPINDIQGHYQKYAINDSAAFTDPAADLVSKSEIVPDAVGGVVPFKCGNNYSRTDSTSTDNTISNNEIKCYNWFDHKNRTDELNVDVPDYIVGEEHTPRDPTVDAIALPDISSGDLGSHPDIRNNYISLSGCEENLCKWPRSVVGYDKPQNRGMCAQNEAPDSSQNQIPCQLLDADATGARGVLGYFTGTPTPDINEQEDPFNNGHDDGNLYKSNFIYPDMGNTTWEDPTSNPPGNIRSVTSIKTAREWANIDITGQYVNNINATGEPVTTHSITCIGANERDPAALNDPVSNECSIGYKGNKEVAWLNSEIDVMVSTAASQCNAGTCQDEINKGQPPKIKDDGTPGAMTSEELQSVGRGGPWSISRCWKNADPAVNPKVTCSRDSSASTCQGLREEMTDDAKATCNSAMVEGCVQKQCKLNPLHAQGGTRILIQTSDEQIDAGATTPATYLSIGGPKEDNIDQLFNVDQIRQITCDYNHSKRNPVNSFGDVICKVDGGFFEITNTCAQTQCEGVKIVDTQHISNVGYEAGQTTNEIVPTSVNSQFARGPGLSWGGSRTHDWTEWSQTPNAQISTYTLSAAIGTDPGMIREANNIRQGAVPGVDDGRRAANDPQFQLPQDLYSPYISGFPIGGAGCSTTTQESAGSYADDSARCTAIQDPGSCNADAACNYSMGDNTFPGRYDTGLDLDPYNSSWATLDPNDDIFNYDIKNYSITGSAPTSTFDHTNIKWGSTCPEPGNTDTSCGSPFAETTGGELHPQGVICRMSTVGAEGAGDPDELTNVTLPVGGSKDDPEPLITCNYEAGSGNLPNMGDGVDVSVPTDWIKPKYKLSHCQRKICTYPNLREPSTGAIPGNIYDGYRYIGSRPGNINEISQPSTCVPNADAVAAAAQDATALEAAREVCNTDFVPGDPSSCTGECTYTAGVSWTGNTDSVNNVLGYEYGGMDASLTPGTSGAAQGGDINTLYSDLSSDDQTYLQGLLGGQDEFGNIGPTVPLFKPPAEYAPYDGLGDVALNAAAELLSLNDFFGGPNATDNLTNQGVCQPGQDPPDPSILADTLSTRAECVNAGHTWMPQNPGYRNKVGASIQCDNRNWYGVPTVKCGQTRSDYLSNTKPNFQFEGCKENTCLIPKKGAGVGTCQPPSSATLDEIAAAAAAADETSCQAGGNEWITSNIYGTMYDSLTPAEKEKWDRVERGYIWPDGTVNSGSPFKTRMLRVDDSTDEQADSDIKCNINFRKNTNTHNIRCPSFRADGSLPQYDETGTIVQLPSVIQNMDDATKASERFGFFTNVVSHKPIPSGGTCDPTQPETCAYDATNPEEEPLRDGGVLQQTHPGVPGEPIDSPRCIENKCTLDNTVACSMDTLHGADATQNCDEKYNWRETNPGQYNGLSNLDSELPGYVFNFYKNSTEQGGIGSEKVEIDVLDIHNQDLTGVELERQSAGNHNHLEVLGDDTTLGTRNAYPEKLKNAIDYPHTVHQLGGNNGLSCAPNYHSKDNETPMITCGANSGADRTTHETGGVTNFDSSHNDATGKFVLSGCYENYCELPSVQDPNTVKYTYTGDNLSNLTNLSIAQGGKITLRQFNKGQGNTLRCAPWTQSIGPKCMNIETPGREYRPYTDGNGQEITNQADCNIGTCVDSSGNEVTPAVATEADCTGENRWIPSVEWVDFTGPRVSCPEHDGVFRFYGCEESVLPTEASGSFYYSPYPGDCIGFWPGSLSHISVAGPSGINIGGTDYAEGEPIGIGDMPTGTDVEVAARNTEMFRFINQCQANCNNNNLCSGFTVQKLSTENAGTSGVPVGTMICNQRTSSSVPQPFEEDTSTSPPTMVRPTAVDGPQQSQCQKTEESSGDWATNWGYNNISEDFELNDLTLIQQFVDQTAAAGPRQVRVIRPDSIPDNQPIYFEKTATPDTGAPPIAGSIR